MPDGKPFEIEFLDFDNALEPHTAPFIKNLKLLGVEARYRVVDAAQYKRRLDDFDYDIVTSRFGLGLTPGEGMRSTFGSEAANLPGSRNVSGIAIPAVDALIEKALVAETREQLTFICRAIDRILRSGHYWVPMWNKPNHLVAYWDVFGRPERGAALRYRRRLDLVVRRGKSQADSFRRPLKDVLMFAYIARRLLFMIPTLFGILLINFVIVQFAPGGPVERILAQLQGLDIRRDRAFRRRRRELETLAAAISHRNIAAPRGSTRNSSPNSKSSSASTSRPMSAFS